MHKIDAQHEADQSQNYSRPFTFGSRRYDLTCAPSKAYLQDAYDSVPLWVAIGVGGLHAIFIVFWSTIHSSTHNDMTLMS
jgi:hypothetical protein